MVADEKIARRKKQATEQLIKIVNPRLVLYTRAGMLAAVILVLNYGAVAGLSLVLMQQCSTIETQDRSEHITSGSRDVWEDFINKTLDKEGTKTSEGVTITTEVSGCVKQNVRTIVAPYTTLTLMRDVWNTPASVYEPYADMGVTVDLPCWDEGLACSPGASFNGDYLDETPDNLGCDLYPGILKSGNRPWVANLIPKVARFPWCTAEDESKARNDYIRLTTLWSDFYSRNVSLASYCGNTIGVAPAGVHTTGVSPLHLEENEVVVHGRSWTTLTPFTTYWDLNVTTTTETCPRFTATFANALAYAAQIEIVITLALIFVFKKAGVVKDAEGVVELGSDRLFEAASGATKSGASLTA